MTTKRTFALLWFAGPISSIGDRVLIALIAIPGGAATLTDTSDAASDDAATGWAVV